MSLGRTSTFLDIYAERDLRNGVFTEEQIQEFVDHFIMKLRLVQVCPYPGVQRTSSPAIPPGSPKSIGGMSTDGRHMVTKMSYRYLHTLDQPGRCPRAQPHRAVEPQPARKLQEVLCQDLH